MSKTSFLKTTNITVRTLTKTLLKYYYYYYYYY